MAAGAPEVNELTAGFEAIESIPDEALVSQDALDEWMSQRPTTRGAIGCGVSVTVALASNAFAVAKIAKIRSAIKAAGGAKNFATQAVNAFNHGKNELKMTNSQAISYAAREAADAGGEDVVNALVDFLSLRGVAEDCFGVSL